MFLRVITALAALAAFGPLTHGRDGFDCRAALTPLGEEAAALVVHLTGWIEGNLPRVLAHRAMNQQAANG